MSGLLIGSRYWAKSSTVRTAEDSHLPPTTDWRLGARRGGGGVLTRIPLWMLQLARHSRDLIPPLLGVPAADGTAQELRVVSAGALVLGHHGHLPRCVAAAAAGSGRGLLLTLVLRFGSLCWAVHHYLVWEAHGGACCVSLECSEPVCGCPSTSYR